MQGRKQGALTARMWCATRWLRWEPAGPDVGPIWSRRREQLDLAPVDSRVHPVAAVWSRAPRFPSAARLSGACAGPIEVATRRESQRSHGPVRCRCNGGSRLSFARSFTLALQRCDHETRNHCGGGRHIGDRGGKRQPLHDVGSCPGATTAARETGGCDRAAGCPSGSTCAGAVEQPACATGLG